MFIKILPRTKCTILVKLFFSPNFSDNKFLSYFCNVTDLKRKEDNDHGTRYKRLVC